MLFLTSVVLLAGLSSTYAAPTAVDPVQDFQSAVNDAIQPVQSEVRSIIKTAGEAASDIGQGISDSKDNILQLGKDLLSPVESKDRANIGGEIVQRILNAGKQIQANAKNLYERAVKDVTPIAANERSALSSLKGAADMLEKKYFTDDGQQVAKVLTSVVGL